MEDNAKDERQTIVTNEAKVRTLKVKLDALATAEQVCIPTLYISSRLI